MTLTNKRLTKRNKCIMYNDTNIYVNKDKEKND